MNLSRADLEILHHLAQEQVYRMSLSRRRKPPKDVEGFREEMGKVEGLASRLHQALQA